jgi:hypothetical protein
MNIEMDSTYFILLCDKCYHLLSQGNEVLFYTTFVSDANKLKLSQSGLIPLAYEQYINIAFLLSYSVFTFKLNRLFRCSAYDKVCLQFCSKIISDHEMQRQ